MVTSEGFYTHKIMNERRSGNVLSVIGIESVIDRRSINLFIRNSDHVGATYARMPTLLPLDRAACFVHRLYSFKAGVYTSVWIAYSFRFVSMKGGC